MPESAITRTRSEVRESTGDAQGRNRAWWESLPMTYEGWEDEERLPTRAEDFARIDRRFLDGNPWLERDYDFDAARGERVLEIGCGAGTASCLFAKAGASVTAIDLTSQAVELTRANARAQGLEVDVRQMDAEAMELPDAGFDRVFSWGVIHHSRSTEAIIREIARVLRPGGRGMCMVYNRASVRYYLLGLYTLLVKGKLFSGHGLESVQGFYTDGFYQRHFTPRELREAFAAEGLACERISVTHMAKRMLPLLPGWLDAWLKSKAGWLLVIEFRKPEAA